MKFKFLFLIFGMVLVVSTLSGVLAFETYINNTNIFVDDFLGVGTMSPSQSLHVNGTFSVYNKTGVLGLFQSAIGKVGIGTTSPSQSLYVNGTFAVYNKTGILGLFQSVLGKVGIGTASPSESLSVNGTFSVHNLSGTLGLFQSATGKVGIGTSSPLTKLQVNGSITSKASIHARDDLDGLKLENGIVRKIYNHSTTTAPDNEDEMKAFFVDTATTLYRVSTENNIDYSGLGDNYAVEMVGYLYANTSGVYTFNTDSDDASDVHIDGYLVADYYGSHGASNAGIRRSVWLEKGFHKVVYRQMEGSGGDSGLLQWQVPGSSTMVTIPSAHYYFDASKNCPVGWWSAAYGRVCMEQTERGAATFHNAVGICKNQGGGARVCKEVDYQQICATGIDPFTASAGWLADKGDGDDMYFVWNVAACSDNIDGADVSVVGASPPTNPYHCCI